MNQSHNITPGAKKVVAVDFDGTIVTHEFPAIGYRVPNAVETLKRLNTAGVKVILWTMRSESHLDAAVAYCEERGIELWGVNRNPEQGSWTMSPKAYAHVYIDDAALGCPLLTSPVSVRPFVDWFTVEKMLEKAGFFSD